MTTSPGAMNDPMQPADEPVVAVSQDETVAWALGVMQSARDGDAVRLESLLARGLPPNLRNGKGDSLLMLACYHGHLDAARVLLAGGADPDLPNDRHQLPLAGAAFRGSMEIARLLLDHGAAPDAAGPDGRTALMTAAMFDRVALIELLVERGADPTRVDLNGHSAADLANKLGAFQAASVLGA
jgi:ankyrin repeat protein